MLFYHTQYSHKKCSAGGVFTYLLRMGRACLVSILIVSSLVDYINGRVIEKHPEGWQAKAALAWSLVFNLGVLFGFKYTAFFVENLNNWFGLGIPVPNIVLPIGISSIAIGARSSRRKTSADFFCMYPCSHSSLQDLS